VTIFSAIKLRLSEVIPKNKKESVLDKTEHSKLREDLYGAMMGVEDPTHRLIISFLLKLFEEQELFRAELLNKLDIVIKDEQAIKEIALNGHIDSHEDHHDWLHHHLHKTDKLEHVIKLSEGHREEGVYCKWASDKMKEEAENKKTVKSFKMDITKQLLLMLIVFVVGLNFKAVIAHFEGTHNADSSNAHTDSSQRP